MVDTIAAARVSDLDIEVVEHALAQLPDKSDVAEMLECLIYAFRRGTDVVYGRVDTEVTPAEAARVLRMSRPHLYKLLADGALPHHTVGSHKRLLLADVMDFQVKQSASRKELAETLMNAASDRDQLVADLAGIPESRRGSLLR